MGIPEKEGKEGGFEAEMLEKRKENEKKKKKNEKKKKRKKRKYLNH